MRLLTFLLAALFPPFALGANASAQCQPPAGYYASVDTSSAAALRGSLHRLIDNHRRVPSSRTWGHLETAEEDPARRGNILTIYRNASYPKAGGGNPFYNREHIWPSSYGFPNPGSGNYPDTDLHALFLADIGYNGARSNKPYKNCDRTCSEFTTQLNSGRGGGSGVYRGNSNWETGFGPFGSWEVWNGRRGDAARALLYMDVRYDGSRHSGGASEPDLVLTDDQILIDNSSSTTPSSLAYMGFLSVVLQWHQQDPPDAVECRRNTIVYGAQGNRNPFIDHPEWAFLIWGRSGEDLRRPWINELHYDNAGADQDEMVEIAGPVGLDLAGYRVSGYNGSNGTVYKNVHLSGTIPGQPGCLGTMKFDFVSMQNGSPDGLALIDPRNRVVEFISYEGTLTATDGPAIGRTSTDIGVSESGSTPIGLSLQLGGTGALRSDFNWQTVQAHTRGQPNAGQTLQGGCGVPARYGCGVNPFDSITLLSGTPSLGRTAVLGIDNPLGTQAPGSAAFLLLTIAPSFNFPCGAAFPGFGMAGPGAVGELLVGVFPVLVTVPGPLWAGPGQPAPVALSIPASASLGGASLFAQGALVDATFSQGVGLGLTDAVWLMLN